MKPGATLRQTKSFQLRQTGLRWFLHYIGKDSATPRGRRIKREDVRYLMDLNRQSFDAACVMDFGVAVFAKRT
jgi:hypothetical protein